MSIWSRWRERRQAREEDLEREVGTDLDLETEEQQQTGVPAGEARHAARRAFGSTALVKEEVREAWGWMWLEQFWQDLRYGFRTLRKNAGFTAVAALSLALGIGGNAAMFSIVNGVLLQPLPYAHPDRLVHVTGYYPKSAGVALQQESRTMEVAGVGGPAELNVVIAGEAQRMRGSTVSANFFSLLGVEAEIGNTFSAGQDRPGEDRVAIISDALWRQRFAGAPGVLGRIISVEGVGRQIVGVMPPGFLFPSSEVQLWIPLHLDPNDAEDYWGKGFMPVVARLRPGATLAQARNELHPLVSHIITLFSFPMGRYWN
ncbi:MAG TPA: ABC transporter permease [Terriglobia bacterium]|nr:ABC transporter permease [Terriglobia bacterium]